MIHFKPFCLQDAPTAPSPCGFSTPFPAVPLYLDSKKRPLSQCDKKHRCYPRLISHTHATLYGEKCAGGGGDMKHWRFPNQRASSAELTGTLAKGLRREGGGTAAAAAALFFFHTQTRCSSSHGSAKKKKKKAACCFVGKSSCGDDLTTA